MSAVFVLRAASNEVTFHAIVGPYKGTIAPAGFRILSALDTLAVVFGHDVTITAGSNGTHSGPDDPHYRGEAYDVRTHDMPNIPGKLAFLKELQEDLGKAFYAFLEDPGTPNEHIHVQTARGTVFPPENPHP